MEKQLYSANSQLSSRPIDCWNDIVNNVYFPLLLNVPNKSNGPFCGTLESIHFGHLRISQLQSTPLSYRRERYHVGQENEDYFLITIPKLSNTHFEQNGKDLECQPGSFFIEGSADPYIFEYSQANRMTVLRIPGVLLRDRVAGPENFCATSLVRAQAGCTLFVDFLHSILKQAKYISDEASLKYSEQLVDLLAIVLNSMDNSLAHTESAAQQAHLHRIYHYINLNLSNPELSPHMIAEKCGVSIRYLHLLFKSTGWTVSGWIREERLKACYAVLTNPQKPIRSFAELAYRWGFSDQTTFNRCFKSKFEQTPKEVRAISVGQ
ncbi:MAG: helix-turn-helix domain-containing protein [Pseudomonadales bacterium]|nr:helix-turn-helix domain-containing protein [Pseudomonadales bacterium]